MSLLLDSQNQLKTTLYALWQAAHEDGAGEPEALSFWRHLFAKHEFSEEHWVCDAAIRASPGSRRRIDRGVRFLSTESEVMVLCWLEANGSHSPGAIKECEQQALAACRESLEDQASQQIIYALTTISTKGKAWVYHRGDRELTALFEGDYVEAHSSEGLQLRRCFQKMKNARASGSLCSANIQHCEPSACGQ